MNRYQNAVIVSTKKLAEGIFQTVLSAEEIAKASLPGQFVCVYSDDGAHLLPRPISICDTDPAEGTIRLVYRVVGFGTDELSKKPAGATARILGPIGTGYESVKEGAEKPLRIVIGGGIGIPPMLLLAPRNDRLRSALVRADQRRLYRPQYAGLSLCRQDDKGRALCRETCRVRGQLRRIQRLLSCRNPWRHLRLLHRACRYLQ